MQNKVDAVITDLTEILDSLFYGPCERVLGKTQSDPCAGEPCGRDGEFREDFDFILCDRCWHALSILETR